MIRIVTAPAAYPITLAEAREFSKVDSSDTSQNATLNMLIAAMTDYAEHLTGRAFVERTLELNLPYFDNDQVLPWAPLIGIDWVKYTDTDYAAQTYSSANYEVDTISEPGSVRLISGQSWPSIGSRFNAVRIQYRAGYRPTGSPTDLTDNSYLPAPLRAWLAARIVTLYDQRSQIVVGQTVQNIPRDFVDGLLDKLMLGTRWF